LGGSKLKLELQTKPLKRFEAAAWTETTLLNPLQIGLAEMGWACFIMTVLLRIWRNWQTRYFEVVVG
jgi:hypothetical protein